MEKKELYIGIDPGVTGAIAVIDGECRCLYLNDCPTEKSTRKSSRKIVSAIGITNIIKEIKGLKGRCQALLEEPIAMPREGRTMGAVSMLSYGRGVGIWEGALSTYGIKYYTVMPRVWKKELLNSSDKREAVKTARKLFPEYKKKLIKTKHGRAEALLIAYYLLFGGVK